MVYKKDYQNRIPRAVVAQHAGYQSLNGKSLSILAALAKYGLLDGRGDENWVTDLALTIIAHEKGAPERQAAIAEAATTPELFAELTQRFPAGGSDAAIKSYLMTRKFLPQAADIVVRTFRETKQFVIAEGAEYLSHQAADEDSPAPREASMQPIESKSVPVVATLSPAQQAMLSANFAAKLEPGERQLTAGMLSKRAKFRVLVTGTVGEREIDVLIRKLELDKEILAAPDEFEEEEEQEA